MLPIPIVAQVEYFKCHDDDTLEYTVTLSVARAPASMTAGIVTEDPRQRHEVAEVWNDGLGIGAHLAQRLLIQMFRTLRGIMWEYDGAGVQWSKPDIQPWLALRFYHADASRIARRMKAHAPADVDFKELIWTYH